MTIFLGDVKFNEQRRCFLKRIYENKHVICLQVTNYSKSGNLMQTSKHLALPPVSLLALFTHFPEWGSHCIVPKQIFFNEIGHVSSTNYFMSIHNFRCSVQLMEIAKRDKKVSLRNTLCPRCWRWNQLCTHHSYACRRCLYVIYIVTYTDLFAPPVTRSEQFKQVWADAIINKRQLFCY